MRQDLATVICEDGRRGPRTYMGFTKGHERRQRPRVAADRERAYAHFEALPSFESMTGRLQGVRHFSENLGPLRGLIATSCGESWDGIYSDLCRLVRPNGTNVERHVHQHLEDFLLMKTRLMSDGVEWCSTRFGGVWYPLEQASSRQQFYVHPITRCICRIVRPPRRAPTPEPSRVRLGPDRDSRHVHVAGIWYLVRLEAARYVLKRRRERHADTVLAVEYATLVQVDRFTRSLGQELPSRVLHHYGDVQLRMLPDERELRQLRMAIFGADLVPISKHGVCSRELRRHGLRNGPAQLQERTREPWTAKRPHRVGR